MSGIRDTTHLIQAGGCHGHYHADPRPSSIVEEQVRKQASDALETMGLSISDAVRVFLARVATEQRIPFAFLVPNAETPRWKARAKSSTRFTCPDGLFDDLEKAARP